MSVFLGQYLSLPSLETLQRDKQLCNPSVVPKNNIFKKSESQTVNLCKNVSSVN